MLSLDKNAEMLSDFGLTHNQAKVYLAIAKLGIATVSQVSKVSKVRREDVYRITPKLEKMGLLEKILGKPTKIRATPVEEALSLLIKHEQDIVNKKVSALMAKKDEFLKRFKAYKMKPISEEAHFTLISQRDGIINKELTMAKNAERAIDVITSRDKFLHVFSSYVKPFKEAIRRGVKVRVILDVIEHEHAIQRILDENELFRASLDIKYTDQRPGHCVIKDYKEALIATSTEPTIGETPYLWTDDYNLVGLLQRKFEGVWHTSLDIKTIETEAITEKLERFLKDLRPTNHVIFLYESSDAKHRVLFNYLKVGLENGEAGVYVASEENPSQIREAMKRFGVNVEKYERTGALHICGYEEIYITDGEFCIATTMDSWNKLYSTALKRGFKGLRVTGETSWFFKRKLIPELIEYEKSLHVVMDIPMIAICAYNANMLIKASNPMDLYNELLKAHGTVLFTGVDNKLGRIQIRKA